MRRHFKHIGVIVLILLSTVGKGQFVINGSAVHSGGGDYLLTPASRAKVGSIWYDEKISLNESFELNFELYFGTSDRGADGITFCLQPLSTGIGVSGGGLGVGGVRPSFFAEFDTYRNGGDPSFDHVAIQRNGDVHNGRSNNLAPAVQIKAGQNNVEDGQWYPMRAVWDANAKRFDLFVDCVLRVTYTGDIVNTIFGGDPMVYWGFTASTGGANNEHRVRNVRSTLIKMNDESICKGESVRLNIPPTSSTFSWSPTTAITGASTLTPTFSPTTTTEYVITYNGFCGSTLKDTVVINVGGSDIDLGNDTTICDDASLTIDAGSYASYTWSTGARTRSIDVNSSGTYSVTVTDADGCTATDDLTLISEVCVPPVDTFYVCEGQSVTIDKGDFDIADWSGSEPFTKLTEGSIEATPTKTTTYYITSYTKNVNALLNGDFEQPYRNRFGIIPDATVPGWSTTAGDRMMEFWNDGFLGTPAYSGDQFVELNANMPAALYQDMATTPGSKLMWGFAHRGRGGVESMHFELGPPGGPYERIETVNTGRAWEYYSGVYEVPAGQTNTRFYYTSAMPGASGNLLDAIEFFTLDEIVDSVVVVVSPLPSLSLGNDTTICDDASLTIDAGSYNSYNWSNGANTQTIEVFATGAYSVNVTDDNGCEATDDINVVAEFCQESLCGGDINFNSWSQAGMESEGNWVVSGDGSSVNQTINGAPTIFVGNRDYLNVNFSGKMRTDYGRDDDWMGMVFGWQSDGIHTSYPITVKSYVFMWKQRDQGAYRSGFTLFEVNGTFNNKREYIDAFATPFSGATVLASNYGTGYTTGQDYTVSIDYNSSNIKAYVDGGLIFDVDGCFDEGKIGFFNHSQPDVTYSDFTYQFIGNIETLDDTLCIGNEMNLAVFEGPICNKRSYYPDGTIFAWDLKDGTTSDLNKVNHTYADTGVYDVELVISDGLGCTDTSVKRIHVSGYPSKPFGNDTTVCSGSNLEIDALNDGSEYLWSTSETSQKINVDVDGEYKVAITNWAECETKDTIRVVFNNGPTVDLGEDLNICEGEEATIDALNPGLSYSWNTGETSQTIILDATGIFGVEVTNEFGCIGSDSMNLIVNTLPVVELGNDTSICIGESVDLDANNTGLNYSWNTGGNSQQITINSSGIYGVEVRDAIGCLGSDSMELIVKDLPIVDLGDDQKICDGKSIELDAENAGLNYNWSNGASSQTVTLDESGIYSVEVTDEIGCLGTDEMELIVNPMPIVNLGNDTAICIGESVDLDAQNPGFNYTWNTGATSQSINITTTGNYEVRVFDEIGCADTSDMNLQVNELPVVDLGEDHVICEFESSTLDAANEGFNFIWNNGATSQTITVSEEGLYSVEVRDEIGCLGTDEIYITKEIIEDPYFEKSKIICEGTSIVLEPDFYKDYSIFWETKPRSSTLEVSETGDYSSIVLSEFCRDTFVVSVNKVDTPDAEIIDVNAQDFYCFDYETTTLKVTSPDIGVDFEWDDFGEGEEFEIEQAGTYSLTATNRYCLARFSKTIDEYCPGRFVIPNAFTPGNDDGLNEVFMPVTNGHVDGFEFRIYNRWGDLIYYTNRQGEGWDGTFNGYPAQIDVYNYRLTYNYASDAGGVERKDQIGTVTLLR